jgi:hypothetical protein
MTINNNVRVPAVAPRTRRRGDRMTSFGDAARLSAGNLDQLVAGLSRLLPNQSGYITAEDFERLTGEELDEFSEQDCNAIGNLAAQHGCTPPIQRPSISRRSQSRGGQPNRVSLTPHPLPVRSVRRPRVY